MFFKTGNETATQISLTNAPSPPAGYQHPYGTHRDSRQTVFAWKSKIDFSDLQNIQTNCYKPMEKLGYNLIGNLADTDNPNFKILVKSAEEIF